MLWLLVATAAAEECAESLQAYVDAIQASGEPEAYQCLIEREDAGAALLEQATEQTPRIRRALAVHWPCTPRPRLERLQERRTTRSSWPSQTEDGF